MADTSALKEKLTPPRKKPKPVLSSSDFLSTGCKVLNAALSGRVDGGFALGTINVFVGDSASGKTLISHNTLAEAAINDALKKYLLIYNNPERREFWEIEKLWGTALAARIQPPSRDKSGRSLYSHTLEDFYFHLRDLEKSGKSFIEIMDSVTNLYSVDDLEKFDDNKSKYASGKEMTGSYGMAKAKKNSDWMRFFVDYLEASKSVLLLINQTRDRIAQSKFDLGPKKTYSGGRSQKFAAAIELWSSVAGKHTKTVNGVTYEIGTRCRIQVKKNSINGKCRTVEISMYDDIGLDDVGTSVDWLVEIGHWKEEGTKTKSGKESKVIVAPELDLYGKRDALIAKIEESDQEDELGLVVQKAWTALEESLAVKRKPRY